MKVLFLYFGIILSGQSISAQLITGPDLHLSPDSLKNDLRVTSNDTLKMVLLAQLRYFYFFEKGNLDSALEYSKQFLPFAQKLNYKLEEAHAYDLIGDIMNFQHNPATLITFFQGVKIAEDPKSENNILPRKYLDKMIYWTENFSSLLIKHNWEPRYFRMAILGSLYQDLGHAYGKIMPNQQRLFFYLSKAMDIYKIQGDSAGLALSYVNIADYFRSTNQLDSCLYYAKKGFDSYNQYSGTQHGEESIALSLMGAVHFKEGNVALALHELRLSRSMGYNYQLGENWLANFTLSEYFFQQGEIDSSIYYSRKAYLVAEKMNLPEEIQQAGTMLATGFERKGITDSALKYFRSSLYLNDSLTNANKTRILNSQEFDEQLHRQELEDEKNKQKLYLLIGGIAALLILAIALFRNNVLRKKSNISLHQKNEEVGRALRELKSAQAQLIQAEKMASLGELTAGIAHEIQNPLNFVNNFSEVNRELADELKGELAIGNQDSDNYKKAIEIANDIKDNSEKINHHGKRAETIVKGMLQHSQKSTGQKEPTNINVIVNENLQLAYHALIGKDKSFEVALKTDLDESIEKINIDPRDIARVLLNIYNNAFYAVNERRKQQDEGFRPAVLVSTKRTGDKPDNYRIEISVKDNGNGIPREIMNKIFQPFFTTKPTGSGTGLGLSLAHDIVKAYGGEIKANTIDGEGAEFIISIPLDITAEKKS